MTLLGKQEERSFTEQESVPTQVVVIGPVPPPTHGQAAVTAALIERIRTESSITVRLLNSNGRSAVGRLLRNIVPLLYLPWIALKSPRRVCYLSVNANFGMWFTALSAGLARVLRYRVYLHHHTYGHLNHPITRMKYLASFAGDDAVHITLCSAMGNQLTQIYPSVREVVPLSNVFLMPSKFLGESAGGESLVLGHISNLTFDKGLRTCVELVRELRKYRRDVKLVIAGPCATADVAAYVEDTVRDNPDFITYLGPVYHERKEQFFAGLDLFVFPTKYRNEAQPLVILEALSHGIPVAAYATACAASDLSGSGCCAVCPSTSFVESALPWILESFATVEAAQRAREAACDQFRLLQAINSGHIDTFISELKTGHNPKGTRNKAHG